MCLRLRLAQTPPPLGYASFGATHPVRQCIFGISNSKFAYAQRSFELTALRT